MENVEQAEQEQERVPAGRVLHMLLDRLAAEHSRAVDEALRAAREESGLPEAARFDMQAREWVVADE